MEGSSFTRIPLARLLALTFVFPGSLLLTQCQTGGGKSIQVGRYTQATLRTPQGHGMERKDYPFDASGKYRTDWVKNNTRGMDPSAHGRASYTSGIEVASAPRASVSADSPPSPAPDTAFDSTPPSGPVPSAAPIASAPPVAAPEPAPRYHRVASGDTLFALSRRYGSSVDELKRVNGLRGDTIHVGQSLRIP